MKKTINGKEYELVDMENNSPFCEGCAFNNDLKLCASIGECWIGTKNMIWKEVKDDSANNDV